MEKEKTQVQEEFQHWRWLYESPQVNEWLSLPCWYWSNLEILCQLAVEASFRQIPICRKFTTKAWVTLGTWMRFMQPSYAYNLNPRISRLRDIARPRHQFNDLGQAVRGRNIQCCGMGCSCGRTCSWRPAGVNTEGQQKDNID